MVSTTTTVCNFGWRAPGFDLAGVDGKRYTLVKTRGPNGLLVMFICNHCPYVKAVLDRIVRDCAELSAQGIGSGGVMSDNPAGEGRGPFAHTHRPGRAG